MAKVRRLLATIVIVAFVLATMVPTALAEESASKTALSARHYNVMLVIDGSGSLTTKNGTDRNGYRYDAVQLFLGLMTNSGNYVGAIVFDDSDPMPLNTDLRPISGSPAKAELSDQIRNADAGGDTDIGGALLEAVNKLEAIQEENGLPSVVVLMSDGITDLPKAPEEALQQSYDNEELAISKAAEHDIPVYAVLLNGNGTVSTGEMEHIAAGTGGAYQEVRNAEDLSDVYTLFYSLIYNTASIIDNQSLVFDENGVVTIEQDVPKFGVEEMNLVANSPSGITSISVTTPSGTPMEEAELEDGTLKSDYYQFIKIEDPEAGLWRFEVHGEPGKEVAIDLIFNSNLSLRLENADAGHSYESGDTATVKISVLDGKQAVTDPDAYNADFLQLTLANASDPEERYPVTAVSKGDHFEAQVPLPEVDKTSTYIIQGTFSTTGINASGNALVIDVNPVTEDNPPVAVSATVEHTVQDSGDGYDYIDLSELFTDADGDELAYSLASSDYSSSGVRVEDGRLVIQADVLTGSCIVRAADGASSAMVTVRLNGNSAPEAVGDSVTLQVETHKLFGEKSAVFSVAELFTDADGDALTYTIIDCDYGYDQDGTIVLDQEAQTLTVQTEDFRKSNLVLRAADSKGASSEITVHFKVLNWWLIYGGIVTAVLVIAGVILVLLAVAAARRRFKGYIRVENVSADSFGSNGGGFRTSHPSQRKKLVLNSLYGVTPAGFSGKCTIFPLSPRKIRFKSPTPFFYNGRKVKFVDISMDSSVTIFATDDAGADGLCISTESPNGFGAGPGGDFGASFGGDASSGGSPTAGGSGGGFSW